MIYTPNKKIPSTFFQSTVNKSWLPYFSQARAKSIIEFLSLNSTKKVFGTAHRGSSSTYFESAKGSSVS